MKKNLTVDEIRAKDFLTVEEASKMLGVSRRTAYRMVRGETAFRQLIEAKNIDPKGGYAGIRRFSYPSHRSHQSRKKQSTMAIKVALREKPISGGRKSLYLDFYTAITDPSTGRPTRREFLGKYITEKPKSPADKQYNREVIMLSEQIGQKRELELNKPEIYTEIERQRLVNKELGDRCFVEYFRGLAKKRKGSNSDNWTSALKYLEEFSGGRLRFSDIDERLCNDLKEFLLTSGSHRNREKLLSTNSAVSYFNKFKAALKQAYKDGLLRTNINEHVDPIKPEETSRNFLTMEEVNALAKTPCADPTAKRAALFSVLTGLRFSDIYQLTWDRVEFIDGEGWRINFRQQKSKGVEYMPISEQAASIMGQVSEGEQRIFDGFEYSDTRKSEFTQWIKAAGIDKKITFHCLRHTFATLQITNGTDIYTVSKLLGHKNVKTTQMYAKIIDRKKREASERIRIEF